MEAIEHQMNIEHFKGTIKALQEKLNILENVECEKKVVEDSLKQSDQARQELRNNIKETAEKLKEDTTKTTSYQ